MVNSGLIIFRCQIDSQQILIIYQMLRSILVTILLVQICTQYLPLVGGYQSYTDLNSSDYQNVLAFIETIHPQVSSYTTSSVQRQLVNGFNYRVTFQSNNGCQAVAVVYQQFSGFKQLTSFTLNCSTAVTTSQIEPLTVDSIAAPLILAGGYKTQSNPSGPAFQNALSRALAQNPQYSRSDLIKTETQVVSGTNYRFTFQNADGTTTQVVEYVPLGPIQAFLANPTAVSSENTTISASNATENTSSQTHLEGGYFLVTDKAQYNDALKAILSQYPEVGSLTVRSVQEQVVAGRNFLINLTDVTGSTIKSALFQVYIDLSGQATVTELTWVNVSGYAPDQLGQAVKDSVSAHPSLNPKNLRSIQNIWQNGQGLKLLFQSDSSKSTVYIYTSNGKTYNLIV